MPSGAILSVLNENVKRSSRIRDRRREKARRTGARERERARTALALLGWHSLKQTSDISYTEMLMPRYRSPGDERGKTMLDLELSLIITVIIYELMHCLGKNFALFLALSLSRRVGYEFWMLLLADSALIRISFAL